LNRNKISRSPFDLFFICLLLFDPHMNEYSSLYYFSFFYLDKLLLNFFFLFFSSSSRLLFFSFFFFFSTSTNCLSSLPWSSVYTIEGALLVINTTIIFFSGFFFIHLAYIYNHFEERARIEEKNKRVENFKKVYSHHQRLFFRIKTNPLLSSILVHWHRIFCKEVMMEPRMSYFQNPAMSHGRLSTSHYPSGYYHREPPYNGMLL
jgi:hypothetical protein